MDGGTANISEENDSDDDFSLDSEDEFLDERADNDGDGTPNKADTIHVNRELMQAVCTFLHNHNEVSYANALALNKAMQQRLQQMRERMQRILEIVQARYKANEDNMHRNMRINKGGIGIRGAYLKGGTFYFKGNMFFKDHNCRNAPNNPDYLKRRADGEMFPMDFELIGRHVWSLVDKAGIVEGIKEQVVEHLNSYRPKRAMSKTASRQKLQIAICSEKLVDLLARVDDTFVIDWQQISIHNLQYRHSPKSCAAMWTMYLHPSLSRSAWTTEENEALLKAHRTQNTQDWEAIAVAVGKRSAYQCFVQYVTHIQRGLPNRWRKWSRCDDDRLREAVKRHTINGVVKWSLVTIHFPHKPWRTVVQRYTDMLDPRVSREPFSPEEDMLLLAAVQEFGTKFAKFPRSLFPHRNITQLRSRYQNTLAHRHQYRPWTIEDDGRLMQFVAVNGTSAWLRCSEALDGRHSRTGCRTRFLTVQRFLAQHPEAVLGDLPRAVTRRVDSEITPQNWLEKVAELREGFSKSLTTPGSSRSKTKNPSLKKKTKKQLLAEAREMLREQRLQAALQVPKMPRSRCKPVYLDRLRPIELQMYHFFKYAYNFRLGVDRCKKPLPSSHGLSCVVQALDFRASLTEEHFVHDRNIPVHLREDNIQQMLHACNTALPSEHQTQPLPPSWPTAMTLRALCIHHAEHRAAAGTRSSDAATATTESKDKVQQLFRMRFRNLMYNAILLSRLASPSIADVKSRNADAVPCIDVKAIVEADLAVVKNRTTGEKAKKRLARKIKVES